jgi:hypothetical protein
MTGERIFDSEIIVLWDDPIFCLRPTPLPYLTALIQPWVKDYRTVSMYIFDPLSKSMHQAEHSKVSAMCQAELVHFRAGVKQAFIREVYFSTASLELKREMYNLPFDEFYEACRQGLSGVSNGLTCQILDEEDHQLIMQRDLNWLIDCAIHPEADIDGTLAPELQKYKEMPKVDPVCFGLSLEQQASVWKQDQRNNVFPGMTDLLHDIISADPSVTPKDLAQMIGHYLQLAMDAVDIWSYGYNYAAMWDHDMILKEQSMAVLAVACLNRTQDPYSETPLPIRKLLIKMDFASNIEFLLILAIPDLMVMGYQLGVLHFMLYTRIIISALQAIDDETFREATFTYHREHWPHMTWYWTRPATMPDLVTAELDMRMRPYYSDDEMSNVPVVPRGPRIDGRGLSQAANDIPTEAGDCPICRESLSDGDEPSEIVKLDTCMHLIHLECLDSLLNTVYPGADAVRCPSCRARLCAPRDYEGVLEEEA